MGLQSDKPAISAQPLPVMPGLMPGIHALLTETQKRRGWPGLRRAERGSGPAGGTSPAMTKSVQSN